jgi:hypothetical protein
MLSYLICGDHNWTDHNYIRKYIRTLNNKKVKLIHGGAYKGVEFYVDLYGNESQFKVQNCNRAIIDNDNRAEYFRLINMITDVNPDKIILFHNNYESTDHLVSCMNRLNDLGYEIIIIKNGYYG